VSRLTAAPARRRDLQCIGQNFARTELRVAIDEFLRRYPDFTIDESGTLHYPSVGMINGYSAMPATVQG
jgi:cytochrome P450